MKELACFWVSDGQGFDDDQSFVAEDNERLFLANAQNDIAVIRDNKLAGFVSGRFVTKWYYLNPIPASRVPELEEFFREEEGQQ